MKRIVFSMFLLSFFGAGAHAASPYNGPLFDAMTQWPNYKMRMDSIVETVQGAGVTKLAIFLRRPSHGRSESAVLLASQAKHPDFIVAGTPKYFRDEDGMDSRELKSLADDLKSKRYAFVSELMLRHFDKVEGAETETGERMIDPFSDQVKQILKTVGPFHVPVMIHWEFLDWEKDFPIFDRFFSAYPEQKFIIPHLGFGSPEQIDRILSKHPNVYVTFSKRVFRVVSFNNPARAKAEGPLLLSADGKLVDAWREVLVRYQDRILFASDTYRNGGWKDYQRSITQYRIALGLLPPEVGKKIAYENAEKLYLGNSK